MRKVNVVIVVCLIALCLVGWVSLATQKVSQNNIYNNYVNDANSWVKKGLYQRAIKNYELALKEKQTEEIYEKMDKAYKKRYEEAPKETLEDYMNFLSGAISVYPANKQLIDSFVTIYSIESEYEEIYNCLKNAIEHGYESKKIQEELLKVKYAFRLLGGEFSGIKQSTSKWYVVSRNSDWNLYDMDEGYLFEHEYEYMSPVSDDGIVVLTGDDSRIIDASGMVLGIFDEKITEAGIYAEGLIPVCCRGKYSYYNDFAEKQFGEYEEAGMFQNGLAAVKKGDKWILINKEGEKESEAPGEIVLDEMGRYMINELILVKESNSSYKLYDGKWKEKATLKCEDVDILTEDGLIAFCKDEKWGYMNTSGEVIIKPKYSDAKSFSNGLAAVCDESLWGFIDKEGNLVIEHQFSDVGYVESRGICPVRIDMPEKENGSENTQVEEVWKFLQLELGLMED